MIIQISPAAPGPSRGLQLKLALSDREYTCFSVDDVLGAVECLVLEDEALVSRLCDGERRRAELGIGEEVET